jgi:hypothetical protein
MKRITASLYDKPVTPGIPEVPALTGSDKAIMAFDIMSPVNATGFIDEAAKTIAVTIPYSYSAAVTSLIPSIKHTGVSVSPPSDTAQDFTYPVSYTVTAADGSTETYIVTVTVASDSAKEITGFKITSTSPESVGVITGTAIAVTVPYGTFVTSLSPVITHTGDSINPASGTAQNFTYPVTYTVTAADGSIVIYTVTVTVSSVLSSIADVITYLSGASGGTSASAPIILPPLDIDLAADWTALLAAIQSKGRYVSLDLSACGMSGTEFNPDNTISTGKQYVTALTLPDTAESIADGLYSSPFLFFNFLKSVSGDNVTDIGVLAFSSCISLTSVTFPEATTIGNQAFTHCTSLTSVTFPEATTIGEYAFGFCTSLGSVSLPASLTSIGDNLFMNCTNLTNITVDPGNTYFKAEGGKLLTKDGTTLISYPSASGTVTLGAPITTIGMSAFYGTGLSSVSLPEVTTIGENAFENCYNLTTVSLPVAQTIDSSAFQGCTALTTVTLPEVTTIGEYAFVGCTALTTVNIPEVTSIDSSAFQGCTALTTVTLPEVTTIDYSTFYGCTALTTVTLPAAQTIGEYAFRDCTSLATVTLSEVTTIGYGAFDSCTALTTVTLPAAQTIDVGAFAFCTALTTMTLPVAQTIGDAAIQGCTALTTVTLPEATTIGYSAFAFCTALTTVTLPAAQTIDIGAFQECTALTTVTLPEATTIGRAFLSTGTAAALTVTLGAVPPTLESMIFYGIGSPGKTVTVRVPTSALSAYGPVPVNTTANNWGNGFRGGGWNGATMTNSTYVNSYINLTIQAY